MPLAWILAGWLALSAMPAPALTLVPMSADEMVQKSDNIFAAVCEAKRTEFRGGNIVTIYTLRPTEFWKGRIPLGADGTFEMEELGGSYGDKLRLGQYTGNSAAMISGEEVLLFTATTQPSPQLAASGLQPLFSPGNQQIVGGAVRGRFSVLTDPVSGEKLVVRLGMESRGIAVNEASVRGFLNAQQRMLRATAPGASTEDEQPVGLDQAELLRRIREQDRVRRAVREANADAADPAEYGLKSAAEMRLPEIRDYEKLANVKNRVIQRVEFNRRQDEQRGR
jgi:hypothetical protein